MTPPADPERYKNHRFPGEIISHGVWLYYRFPLSYRDVQELLCEREIDVTHEGIRQWCLKFGQAYANQLKHRRARPGGLTKGDMCTMMFGDHCSESYGVQSRVDKGRGLIAGHAGWLLSLIHISEPTRPY